MGNSRLLFFWNYDVHKWNSNFRIQEKVSLSRPSSQCNEDNSQAKMFRKGLKDIYLNGMECQNTERIPCMIPQVKNMLTLDEQKDLQPCLSWAQYNCMLMRLSNRDTMTAFITPLKKDCKLKTIHLSSQKTYYLDEFVSYEVI